MNREQRRALAKIGRKKRGVGYGRYSSNNQREESIDAQLRAIREYCEKEDIELVAEYYDEAQTGTNDGRDDFQEMVNAILKGYIEVDFVLVHKFNRFARNKYDSALYKKRLREIGVRVISVTQKIDDTPEGEMLEGFIEVIDEYYSANLALEVKKGLKENALKGKYTGGKIPYGLRVDDEGYFCPDEKTAPVVRRIFEMYADGVPKGHIVKMLNEEGYRNQYGRFFNVRTIFDMLQNEKYVGVYIYRHTQEEIIKLEGVIKNPIIDIDLWEKVTALRYKTNKPKFRERKRYYYLTGRTVCGCCGYTYCGAGAKKTSATNTAAYYKCSGQTKARNGCKNKSLNKEYYEQKIIEKVTEAVFTPERVREIAEQVYKQLEADRKAPITPTATLKKQLAEVKAQQAELLDIMLSSKISRDILEMKEASLAAQQKTLEKNIKKNNELESSQIISVEKIEQYINSFKVFVNEKKDDNHIYIKSILDTFVNEVIVNPDDITVKIKVDFSAFDFTPRGEIAHYRGALCTIAPLNFNISFQRKKHTQRLE